MCVCVHLHIYTYLFVDGETVIIKIYIVNRNTGHRNACKYKKKTRKSIEMTAGLVNNSNINDIIYNNINMYI